MTRRLMKPAGTISGRPAYVTSLCDGCPRVFGPLILTFRSADCACIDGVSVTLLQTSTGIWSSGAVYLGPCELSLMYRFFTVFCVAGNWSIEWGFFPTTPGGSQDCLFAGGEFAAQYLDVTSKDPLTLTWNTYFSGGVPPFSLCSCPDSAITGTITIAPGGIDASRHLIRDTGQVLDGRRVFELAECVDDDPDHQRGLIKPVGTQDGRAAYVVACCPELGVVTGCCPNRLPATLYGTFNNPACPCLDGRRLTFHYQGLSGCGYRNAYVSDPLPMTTCTTETDVIVDWFFCLYCDCSFGPCVWTLLSAGALSTSLPPSATSKACILSSATATAGGTCDPFFQQFTGSIFTYLGAAGCDCNGLAYTLTVTE